MRIVYSVCCGTGKQHCEDTALVENTVLSNLSSELNTQVFSRIAILDGVGGLAGGAKASRFVAEEVLKLDFPSSVDDLRNSLISINEKLISYATDSGLPNMATTLTGMIFDSDLTYVMHAGNTRIYTVRDGYLKQLTEDQTSYQIFMSLGYYDYAKTCSRSEIRCVFGGGNPRFLNMLNVKLISEKMRQGVIVLTSDGVHDFLSDDEIVSVINDSSIPTSSKAKCLTDKALDNGSDDDRSVIIVEF